MVRRTPWPLWMRNPFRYFKTSPEIIRVVVVMYVGGVRGNRLEADRDSP